ncbi:MAG: hypothetical protein KDA99_11615 [Planctomycetales bacterium]|nr:hypothetical protein [Planctomycetales bacterium]
MKLIDISRRQNDAKSLICRGSVCWAAGNERRIAEKSTEPVVLMTIYSAGTNERSASRTNAAGWVNYRCVSGRRNASGATVVTSSRFLCCPPSCYLGWRMALADE